MRLALLFRTFTISLVIVLLLQESSSAPEPKRRYHDDSSDDDVRELNTCTNNITMDKAPLGSRRVEIKDQTRTS